MGIGRKIASLRKERNMTQKELADFLNVTDKAVSRWESGGNPDIEIISKIAKLFNVTTDYLLDDNAQLPQNNTTRRKKDSSKTLNTILLVLLFIGFVVFVSCLSVLLSAIIRYNIALNNAAETAPVGLSFLSSELSNKTVEFAASQGVTITKESETFVQWQTALLTKYTPTFVNGQTIYTYNGAPIFNNNILFLLIPIFVSLIGLFVDLLFLISHFKKNKKE